MLVVRSYVQSYRPNLFPVMKWAYTKKPRPSGKCKRITKSSSNSFLASWFYCYTNICTFDSAQKYNKKSGRPPNSELQIGFWASYFLQAKLWATMFHSYSTFNFFYWWNINKIAPLESTKRRNKCSRFTHFCPFWN